jgi:hypothetical protein
VLLQQVGNVNGGTGAGSSHPIVPHAPVAAPVIGSAHGAQCWPAAQVDVSSVGCEETAGKQSERHRPAADVPANAMQLGGSTLPPAVMRSSGAQRPALAPLPHGARLAACEGGTYASGRQCAPEQTGSQLGNTDALITGDPVQGQVRVMGGRVGASQPSEQAPVGAVGVADVGS